MSVVRKKVTKENENWLDYFTFVEENGKIIRKFVLSVQVPCSLSFSGPDRDNLAIWAAKAGTQNRENTIISIYDFMVLVELAANLQTVIWDAPTYQVK